MDRQAGKRAGQRTTENHPRHDGGSVAVTYPFVLPAHQRREADDEAQNPNGRHQQPGPLRRHKLDLRKRKVREINKQVPWKVTCDNQINRFWISLSAFQLGAWLDSNFNVPRLSCFNAQLRRERSHVDRYRILLSRTIR